MHIHLQRLLVISLMAHGFAAAQAPTAPTQQPSTPPKGIQRPNLPNIPRPTLPPGFQRPGAAGAPGAAPGQIRPGAAFPPTGPTNVPGAVPSAVGTATPAGASNPSAPKNGPTTPPKASSGENGPNMVDFDAASIDEVLAEYSRVSKRRVLNDRGMENATVTIKATGEFTDIEYIDVIEKGLLMHGYALVPSGDSLYKLVAAETGSSPGAQNLPMILRSEELPKTDQVVMHVAQLQYVSSEDAATTLQNAIAPHPYGKIVAVPNARSLVITEASQTIRAYLELLKQIDLPPSLTEQKTIKLERTDPEEVAKMLESLLDLDNKGGSSSSSGSSPRPATPTAPRAPAIPGIPQQAGGQPAQQPASAVVSASGGGMTAEGPQPMIMPMPRTSSLLVIARPHDILRIEKLVQEIDAEARSARFVSRRLNYIDLTTFLQLAEKALMRWDKNAQGSSSSALGTTTGSNSSSTNNTNSNFGSNFGNSGFGNSGFGGSSFGGGLGGGGFGGGGMGGGLSGGGAKLDVTTKASSVLIGRTLVLIDPGSSKFFASGPPEQLQMLEDLADELDVRPRQIMLSAVIGEFSLSDDFSFGLDWLNSLQGIGNESGRKAGGAISTQGTFFDPSTLANPASFVGSAAASLGGLSAYGHVARNLHVFMNTVEGTGRFKALQKPILTTLNHQKAQIYVGEQIPIAGNSFTNGGVGGFTTSTQFIPIRIQLDITPHIYNDREVMLEFNQQNNSQGDKVTVSPGVSVPGIREQGMSNSLIVPDRTVAMLGGLISEDNRNDSSGVPFLVRLPLIKYLFGRTQNKKNRKEIMIFVQPAILDDGARQIEEQRRLLNESPVIEDVMRLSNQPVTTPNPSTKADFELPKKASYPEFEAQPIEKKGLLDKFKGLFHLPNQKP
ncbi:MAG: hypothetical protein IPK32_05645 [Verrucomicrobiaceae bacterium]|nr:hypothetical protein [Verrucomicrobiaceae bacterium]